MTRFVKFFRPLAVASVFGATIALLSPLPAQAATASLQSLEIQTDGVTVIATFDIPVEVADNDGTHWEDAYDPNTFDFASERELIAWLQGPSDAMYLKGGQLTSFQATIIEQLSWDSFPEVVSFTNTSGTFAPSTTWQWVLDPDELRFLAVDPDTFGTGRLKDNNFGPKFVNAGTATVIDDETTTGTPVTNLSTQPLPAPTVADATINNDGDKVTVEFDQNVSLTGDGGTWKFLVDGVPLTSVGTPVSASGSSPNNQWVFTLPEFVRQNQDIYIRHTASSGTDNFTNGSLPVATFAQTNDFSTQTLASFNTSSTPADAANPTIDSAALGTDGKTITVTFNEDMHSDSSVSGFSVSVDGTAATIDSISNIGSYETTLTISMVDEINSDATVTLDYDATAGDLKDIVAKPLQNVTAQAVTNGSQIAPPAPPAPDETEEPAPTPAPPYTGPLVTGSEQTTESEFATAGQETVVIRGERLGTVSKVTVDGIEAEILNVTANSFEIAIPLSLAAGTYDLQIESGIGNLTYLDGLTVTESTPAPELVETETDVVETEVDTKVNAGSFKGFVAVYAKGHEGKRLSAKVGNDWVIIPELESNFERIVEFIGAANVDLNIRVYIDRALTETIPVTTRM